MGRRGGHAPPVVPTPLGRSASGRPWPAGRDGQPATMRALVIQLRVLPPQTSWGWEGPSARHWAPGPPNPCWLWSLVTPYSAPRSTRSSWPGRSLGWLGASLTPAVAPLGPAARGVSPDGPTPHTENRGGRRQVNPHWRGGQAGQCGPLTDPCQNPPQGAGVRRWRKGGLARTEALPGWPSRAPRPAPGL